MRETLEHQTRRCNQLLQQQADQQGRAAALESRADEAEGALRQEKQRAGTIEAQLSGERGRSKRSSLLTDR